MYLNYFFIVIALYTQLFQLFCSTAEQTKQCGNDWNVYGNEKCFKVFHNKELQKFSDAVNTCYENEGSGLLTIDSHLEQNFMVSLLDHKHNIKQNVWLGYKLQNNIIKLSDNTAVKFTNLAKNIAQNSCIELSLNNNFTEKWLIVSCDNRNVVVCQKAQNPLFVDLQKQIMEFKVILEKTQNELKDTKSELKDTKARLENELQKTKRNLNDTENVRFNLKIEFNISNRKHDSIKCYLNTTYVAIFDTNNLVEVTQNEKIVESDTKCVSICSNKLSMKAINEINNNLNDTKIELNNTRNERKKTNRDLKNTLKELSYITLNDCLLSDVWIDCGLFIDYNTNISQIIAKPKNVSELWGTWDEAINICAKYNSSLVSIESHEKQKFIQSIKSFRFINIHWTSGRKNSDAKWVWSSSGNEFQYTNWNENNSPNDEKIECLAIVDGFEWFDSEYCDNSSARVLCEYDVRISSTKLENFKQEMIDQNETKRDNVLAKSLVFSTVNDIINYDINNARVVRFLELMNRNRKQILNYTITYVSNVALNLCLSSKVWNECKLFIDYKNDIYQIMAKPKNEGEMKYTWDEAMIICAKYNSSLISIESQEKQDSITSLNHWYWTSGRKNSDGKWIWNSTGNELTYNKWDWNIIGITPYDSVIECLVTSSNYWRDEPCNSRHRILCEFYL